MNIGLFLGAGASTLYDMPTTMTIMDEIKNTFSESHFQYILNNFEDKDLEVIYQEVSKTIELLSVVMENKLFVHTHIKHNNINISLNHFSGSLKSLLANISHLIHKKYYLDENYNSEAAHSTFKKLVDFCLKDTQDLDIFTTNYDNSVSSFCKKYQNDYRFCDGFMPHEKSDQMIFNENFLTNAFENEAKSIIRLFKLHGSVDWAPMMIDGIDHLGKNYNPDNYVGEFTPPTLINKKPDTYPTNILNQLFAEKFSEYDLCIIIGTSFRDQHINEVIKKRIADKKLTILISPTILHDYAKHALGKDSNNEEYLSEITKDKLNVTSMPLAIKFNAKKIDELLSRISNFIKLLEIKNLDTSNTNVKK